MIIDRGSREREAEEELEIICEKVKQKGNYDFTEFCFLKLSLHLLKMEWKNV